MIETIETQNLSAEVFRLARLRDELRAAERLKLDSEAERELLDLVREHRPTPSLKDLIDGPFEYKTQLNTSHLSTTRYSDGTWRVFYAALSEKTAQAECLYHFAKVLLGDGVHSRTAYYQLFSCKYDGGTKDLRPKLSDWPELISDDYTFCNGLGNEAKTIALSAFFAPSARMPEGTSTPTFLRAALSNPRIIGEVHFTNSTEGGIAVESIPTP